MSARSREIRPEIASEGLPAARPRWTDRVTSADHKDIGRIMVAVSLGFLFIAGFLLVLMRLQLIIPENGLLDPVTFDRLLSVYGATALFCFGLPLVFGLFYYVLPLQIGARATALPRLGQTGLWMYLAGAMILFITFFYTPPEAGINPLPPLSGETFIPNNGVDAWLTSVGFITFGLLLLSIDLVATARTARAPGMAWRRMPVFSWAATASAWVFLAIGSILLAAMTMLFMDRNLGGDFFDGAAGGAPLLWQHLSWIFFTGAFGILVVFALGALAEIIPALSNAPLRGRNAVIGSLVAIAMLAPLAWMVNMHSAPVGIGWSYFGMIVALLMVIPVGIVFFNLLATLAAGLVELRAPMLFAVGALSLLAIGLALELLLSLVAVGGLLGHTVTSTAASHYALTGATVLGGFAALHFWYPKMTGRVLGETLGKISFWIMFAGANLAFLPLVLAGLRGQVADAYKIFEGTGVAGYNFVAGLGAFLLFVGLLLGLANCLASLGGGRPARHDQWGGSTLEWYTLSPPPSHNYDVLPDVRSPQPLLDIREAIARRRRRDSGEHEVEPASDESQPVA